MKTPTVLLHARQSLSAVGNASRFRRDAEGASQKTEELLVLNPLMGFKPFSWCAWLFVYDLPASPTDHCSEHERCRPRLVAPHPI